tara:strand:- start:4939 stop:5964 length:1026 start_codon:yes stop_codon:yes gene_type:complete
MKSFIALLFLIFYCNTIVNAQSKVFGLDGVDIQTIESETVDIDKEFYQANDMLFLDEKVVITDKSNEPAVLVFSKNSAKKFRYVTSYGKPGRGPGDFEDPWEVFKNPNNDSRYYVYDAINRRIAVYTKDSELLENSYISVKGVNFFTSIFKKDDAFYAAGITPECQVLVFDSDGEKLDCLGDQPSLNLTTKVSIASEAQRWHSYAAMNQVENKVALFYRHAIRARLIETDGTKLNEIVDEKFGVPFTEVINGNAAPTNADMRAFISVTSNNEYIYALYSGRISNGPSSSLGIYVMKYDWDLNLLDVYKLDHSSINIHVDEDGNLYSIEYEPESKIRLLLLE